MSKTRRRRGPLRFPVSLRMRRKREFDRALVKGARASDGRLTVWVFPNGLVDSRLGLVVGRKHGGAVRRNRIKRILREAYRLSRARLPPGLDVVCTPRVGADIRLRECIQSLVQLTARLSRRVVRGSRAAGRKSP